MTQIKTPTVDVGAGARRSIGLVSRSFAESPRRGGISIDSLSVDKFGLPLTLAPGLNPRRSHALSPCPMTMSDSFLAASRNRLRHGTGKEARCCTPAARGLPFAAGVFALPLAKTLKKPRRFKGLLQNMPTTCETTRVKATG